MAHIKLLDPFKKELRDMEVYTLAEFGATSVKRFKAGGFAIPLPYFYVLFIILSPLSPPIPFRDDKLPSHSHRWYPTPEPRHYPYPNDNPRKTLSHRNDGDNACHQPHQRKYIC